MAASLLREAPTEHFCHSVRYVSADANMSVYGRSVPTADPLYKTICVNKPSHKKDNTTAAFPVFFLVD